MSSNNKNWVVIAIALVALLIVSSVIVYNLADRNPAEDTNTETESTSLDDSNNIQSLPDDVPESAKPIIETPPIQ